MVSLLADQAQGSLASGRGLVPPAKPSKAVPTRIWVKVLIGSDQSPRTGEWDLHPESGAYSVGMQALASNLTLPNRRSVTYSDC